MEKKIENIVEIVGQMKMKDFLSFLIFVLNLVQFLMILLGKETVEMYLLPFVESVVEIVESVVSERKLLKILEYFFLLVLNFLGYF